MNYLDDFFSNLLFLSVENYDAARVVVAQAHEKGRIRSEDLMTYAKKVVQEELPELDEAMRKKISDASRSLIRTAYTKERSIERFHGILGYLEAKQQYGYAYSLVSARIVALRGQGKGAQPYIDAYQNRANAYDKLKQVVHHLKH